MPFFSKRVAVAATETVNILNIPANVKLCSLAIKAEGGTILVSPAGNAETEGMTFTDGAGCSFSEAELKALTREKKELHAYSAAGADVELFGIIEW